MQQPQIETDAAAVPSSQTLEFSTKDTLKYLLESLENDPDHPQLDLFRKTMNQGTYTFTTSSCSDEEVNTTKCEIMVDRYVPNFAPLIPSYPQPTQPACFDYYPQVQNHSTYSGQVPTDVYCYQQDRQNASPTTPMNTYPDGAAPMSMQMMQQYPPQAASPSPMSALPSNTPFEGQYQFRTEFDKQPKDTKATLWTYSPTLNKLFAQKDALCPIKFAINCNSQANGFYIRALPVYSRPKHMQEVVRRCPNHIQSPESANIHHKEHIIWCENQSAQYIKDTQTERCAVRVPYDLPPAGTDFVTLLFSFKCLSTCVGGPNRREMSVIFTLESDNQEILGRQIIDLKICACPGRDRKCEENKLQKKQAPSTAKPEQGMSTAPSYQTTPPTTVLNSSCAQAGQRAADACGTVTQNTVLSVNKRRRVDDSDVYSLSIRGRRNYELLCNIRDSLEMCDLMPNNERERFVQQRRDNDIRNQQQQQQPPPMHQPRLAHQQFRPPLAQMSGPFTMQPQQQQQQTARPVLPMSGSRTFNFSSSRGGALPNFNSIKRDLVDSTQSALKGHDVTDGGAPPPHARTVATLTAGQPSSSVARWLTSLGLGAYVDNFHSAGLRSMDQLKSEQNFTINDLENMKLTKATVTQIWNALKVYRADCIPATLKPEAVTLPDSQGSTSGSASSAVTLSGSNLGRPGQLEFTRYSFKFTVLKRAKASSDADSTTEKKIKLEKTSEKKEESE